MRGQSYLKRFIICTWTALAFSLGGQAQFYDGSNVTFGKNRVQYQTFDWQYFPATRGEVYYYQGGKNLASRIVAELTPWAEEVEKLLDRKIDGAFQVLVFNKQEDFRQSNIGFAEGEDENIGGTAILVGSKLFVYAEGEWSSIERQVKRGLTQLLFNQIMFGGNWQEALRNSSTIALPDWFTEGLFSYASQPWNSEVALHVYDVARCNEIAQAQRIDPIRAPWVGHAIWKYVADVFGEGVIANAMYMIRISRSLNKGFQYATGMDLPMLLEEANRYHLSDAGVVDYFPPMSSRKDIRRAKKNPGDLMMPIHAEMRPRSISLSPEGDYVAWMTEERGQIKVWLGHIQSGKTTLLGKHGHKIDRIQGMTNGGIAWHPNGQLLTYSIEEQSRNFLFTVNVNDPKEVVRKEIFQIDKIHSMAYAPDGMTMIWSAVRNGQTDLYQYQVLGNNQMALWSDPYDDLDPVFSKDGNTIWFASNRPNADLNHVYVLGEPVSEHRDIFALEWREEIPQLLRWVETPGMDERFPQFASNGHITYLKESPSGTQERWVAWRDSAIAFIDTTIHYRYFTQMRLAEALQAPVSDFQFLPFDNSIGLTHQLQGHTFWKKVVENRDGWSVKEEEDRSVFENASVDLNWDWTPQLGEVDFRNYQFGPWIDADTATEEEEMPGGLESDSIAEDAQKSWSPFSLPKPRNYRLNYAMESITGQLDNSFSTNFYQVYSGNITGQPGLGGLSRISMSDLFEDKRFTAGFRLSGSLENSRYMLSYSDHSGRLDRTWILERQGVIQSSNNNQTNVKTHIHLLRHQLSFPFDEVRSLRLQALLRLDRNTPLATDAFNLTKGVSFANQIGMLLSYVHDDTRQRTLNIREGLRYKIWAEYMWNPAIASSTFGTMGFDLRYYKPLWRNITWAFRAAGDWSIGAQRLLHSVGGVDNVLSISTNSGSPIDPNIPYAYQTRITPLRGFGMNARNGSHMSLINSEIRIPIWSSLSNQPVESDFFNHLQCIGFADMGSAWNGLHPYDTDNTFNQITVVQNPITVTIDNNREPIIWGTGFGFRSRVFGYWMRADWCWGVDDGRWLERVFNLSFHMDF